MKKYEKNTRNLEKLRKFRRGFEKLTGGRVWKFFGEVSARKVAIKNRFFQKLKDLKKGVAKKIPGQVKNALKWAGPNIKGLRASLKTKFLNTKIGAKIGAKLGGKSIGKLLSKVTFGLLDVGLGIWDIVDGVNTLKKGSSQAREFRKSAKEMEKARDGNF